jgi:hypothetical protein
MNFGNHFCLETTEMKDRLLARRSFLLKTGRSLLALPAL